MAEASMGGASHERFIPRGPEEYSDDEQQQLDAAELQGHVNALKGEILNRRTQKRLDLNAEQRVRLVAQVENIDNEQVLTRGQGLFKDLRQNWQKLNEAEVNFQLHLIDALVDRVLNPSTAQVGEFNFTPQLQRVESASDDLAFADLPDEAIDVVDEDVGTESPPPLPVMVEEYVAEDEATTVPQSARMVTPGRGRLNIVNPPSPVPPEKQGKSFASKERTSDSSDLPIQPRRDPRWKPQAELFKESGPQASDAAKKALEAAKEVMAAESAAEAAKEVMAAESAAEFKEKLLEFDRKAAEAAKKAMEAEKAAEAARKSRNEPPTTDPWRTGTEQEDVQKKGWRDYLPSWLGGKKSARDNLQVSLDDRPAKHKAPASSSQGPGAYFRRLLLAAGLLSGAAKVGYESAQYQAEQDRQTAQMHKEQEEMAERMRQPMYDEGSSPLTDIMDKGDAVADAEYPVTWEMQRGVAWSKGDTLWSIAETLLEQKAEELGMSRSEKASFVNDRHIQDIAQTLAVENDIGVKAWGIKGTQSAEKLKEGTAIDTKAAVDQVDRLANNG